MDIRQITPHYFVAPQIDPADMAAIKAAGITRILCNRPDAEVPPSHQAAAMRRAAEAEGLEFVEQPLDHRTMVPDVINKNRSLGVDTDQIVLAYCASGTRSTIAWALGQAGQMAPDQILSAARTGGYELAHLRHLLERPFTG